MERLTDASTHDARSDATIRDIVNRLAAYEDTGLAPEEITAIINGHRGISGDPSVITLFGKPLSHWLELHKAEETGMLVHLPCPLGTTVYIITAVISRGYPDPLIEQVIREEKFTYEHLNISPRYLFFSYAEAEAALKKRKE